MIHVCSLAALSETVRRTGASHVLTVKANVEQVARPVSVLPANHLKVSMDDITEEMDGFVAPSETHIDQVLNFLRGRDRGAPLVVHSYAGISRSTARAFAAVSAAGSEHQRLMIFNCDDRGSQADFDRRQQLVAHPEIADVIRARPGSGGSRPSSRPGPSRRARAACGRCGPARDRQG